MDDNSRAPSDDQSSVDTGRSHALSTQSSTSTQYSDNSTRSLIRRQQSRDKQWEEDDALYRYGWCGFTPDCIQKMNNGVAWGIIAAIAGAATAFAVNGTIGLVITSLETRFSLSSSHTSWVSNAAELSPIPVYIVISMLGSNVHRPRLTALGVCMIAVGAVVFALPHWTTKTYIPGDDAVEGNLCYWRTDDECIQDKNIWKYVYVFIIARLVMGFGVAFQNTCAVTFLDDVVSRENFAFLSALVNAGSLVGPALSFMLGGYMLSIYTDFRKFKAKQLGFDKHDERWVGAWWLPYVVAFIWLTLCILPIGGFPRDLPGAAKIRSMKVSEAYRVSRNLSKARQSLAGPSKTKTCMDNLREVPAQLRGLFKNPVFLCLVFFQVFNAFIVSGFITFGPKFVENQFGRDASTAGMVWGLTIVSGGMLGTITGGILIKRLKLSCSGIIKCQVILSVIGCFGLASTFLHCETVKFAGANVPYHANVSSSTEINLKNECNSNCTCYDLPFDPVCGVDNVIYYSPCYAGCTNYTKDGADKNFYDCSCIPSNNPHDIMATNSYCDGPSCSILPVFVFIFFLTVAALLMCQTMNIAALLRVVRSNEKAMAITLYWTCMRLFGNVPGTIIIGKIFDMNCLLWENVCNQPGSCISYNVRNTAITTLVTVCGMKFVSLILIMLAWRLYKAPPPPAPTHEIHVGTPPIWEEDEEGEDDEEDVFTRGMTTNNNETHTRDKNAHEMREPAGGPSGATGGGADGGGAGADRVRSRSTRSSRSSRFSRSSMKLVAPFTADSAYDHYDNDFDVTTGETPAKNIGFGVSTYGIQ